MSAARLAAELAFSLPPQPASADSGPIVVVRRAKGITRDEAVAAPVPTAAEDADARHKGPRIFRVASASGLAADGEAHAQALHAGDDQDLPHARRRRLLAADRRPGPLLQVYQAPHQPQFDVDAGADAQSEGSPRLLEALARQLAGIEPVFDDIRRAQAFRFREDGSDEAWQGLSVAADTVHGWIQVQLDNASSPPEEPAVEAAPPAATAPRGPSRQSVFQRRRT